MLEAPTNDLQCIRLPATSNDYTRQCPSSVPRLRRGIVAGVILSPLCGDLEAPHLNIVTPFAVLLELRARDDVGPFVSASVPRAWFVTGTFKRRRRTKTKVLAVTLRDDQE